MRAVAVEKLKGEPRLMDLPQPVAKADQLLVKVSAAGINPVDWKLADGMLDGVMPNVLPFVLGVDAAGIVDLCRIHRRTGNRGSGETAVGSEQ